MNKEIELTWKERTFLDSCELAKNKVNKLIGMR